MRHLAFSLAILTIAISCTTQLFGQRGLPAKQIVTLTHTTNYAQQVDFKPGMVKQLTVPAGWKVNVAAAGLGKPRMLYTGPNGGIYVTRRDAGDVLMLKDTDGDNKFDDMVSVVANFKGVHGITIKNGWLYLCNSHELRRYPINSDGTVGAMQTLFNDMPDGGQHPNRTMEFGPDGMLYISVGSLCNDCAGADKEVATMLQVDTTTWKRTIFASGLRNTIGFDFQPQTGEMWGIDNGGDTKGDDWPPEEVNKIIKGGNYGWPYAYGKREIDQTREDPPGSSKEALVKNTQPSVLEFTAHSAPIAFRFFGKATNIPAAVQNDGLVCWHGSWDRKIPSGFKVSLIKFQNGNAVSIDDFLTGFLSADKRTRFGRPAGLTITPTGIIYVSDDANGVIYCIKKTS